MKIVSVYTPYERCGGEDIVFQNGRGLLQSKSHEVVKRSRNDDEAKNSYRFADLNWQSEPSGPSTRDGNFAHGSFARDPDGPCQ